MGNWEELRAELVTFLSNVYFQPPSNVKMNYPCIVFNKTGKTRRFGNNKIYFTKQEYQVTVIELTADSDLGDRIEKYFQYAGSPQYYTVDNLHHTNITLYY